MIRIEPRCVKACRARGGGSGIARCTTVPPVAPAIGSACRVPGPAPAAASGSGRGNPEHDATRDALLRIADSALYQAKERGRDRVVVWSAHLPAAPVLELVDSGA